MALTTINPNLTINWILSHSNVKGNEEADQLAKKAAEGRSSTAITLPHPLRSPLPKSTSAVKQAFHATLHKTWLEKWGHSPRMVRLTQTGDVKYEKDWKGKEGDVGDWGQTVGKHVGIGITGRVGLSVFTTEFRTWLQRVCCALAC